MPPRFLVDENAARLVRWLRLMGYDATFLSGVDDATVVARARQESRILLTRDHGIMARRPVAAGEVRTLLLRSDDTWTQLEQVVGACGLDPRRASFTRCVACNGPLTLVPAAEARPFVPSFVADRYAEFMHCAHCGRYYWPGTHWQRVTDRLDSLPARDDAP